MLETIELPGLQAALRNSAFAEHLQRFAEFCRRDVMEWAMRSERFAELSESFPALLFALATRHGTVAARERCAALVLRAKPLKQAATAIGLPMWLKRLPPEAFEKPLGAVPNCADFARRIAAFLPDHRDNMAETAAWLQSVLLAADACHEEFALWMARHRKGPINLRSEERLCLLAAWAWHADQPQTLGHRLIRQKWLPHMSLKRAQEEARVWERRIELAVMLKATPRVTWLNGATVNGYEFVPLETIEDFLLEGAAMNNCLDQYGEQLGLGMNRVYSIRFHGRRVADIEIGGHHDDATVPTIVQLRGPRNHRVGSHIWRAAYAWIASQPPNIIQPPSRTHARKARDTLMTELWSPYLTSRQNGQYPQSIHATIFDQETQGQWSAKFPAVMRTIMTPTRRPSR